MALDLCGAPPATLTVMGGASSSISPHGAEGVRKHPLAPVSAIAVQESRVPVFTKRAWCTKLEKRTCKLEVDGLGGIGRRQDFR